MHKLVLALCALLAVFTVNANEPALLETLKDMKDDREVKLKREEQGYQLMVAEALALGSKGGYFHRAKEINEYLKKLAPRLDETHNINHLGLVKPYKGLHIVYPVITVQEHAISSSEEGRSFIIRDKVYRIAKDPKIRVSPPSWRDYLLMTASAPGDFPAELLPRNRMEEEAWEAAVEKGWRKGIEYADREFQRKHERLARDIDGMQRFVLLRQRRMVSDIQIADKYFPVSGGGHQLNIQESRVSIALNPALSSNRWNWEPVPELADITELFPNALDRSGFVIREGYD